MLRNFIKNKEDFICEHCGFAVQGTGYTNHCPECFWSKHVDIVPGDRAQVCKGIMKPISVQGSTNKMTITHKCTVCNFVRNNKIQKEDNLENLSTLMLQLNSRK